MRDFISFFLKTIPLSVGIILSLTALYFLVEFFDRGLDFEDSEFWSFLALFLVGFPLLLWGVQSLSENTPNKNR